jgi:tetratricopeptide (TPR) repeat protein
MNQNLALADNPHDASRDAKAVRLHIELGNALLAQGALVGAAANFRRVLSVQPKHWVARMQLARVLKLSTHYDAAIGLLQSLVAEQPGDAAVHKELGRVHFARRQLADALESFQHALTLNPDDADVHHWLANVEELRGNSEASQRHFQQAVALNPLLRVPGVKSPADFSVLLLFAHGDANTPPMTLVRMATYDSYFLLLAPSVEYDVQRLQSQVNLVVNLISDVDQAREILPAAAALVDRLGMPVVNHPRTIMKTSRESVSALLSGVPSCRVPRVQYYSANELTAAFDANQLKPFSLPFLARVAGTHGGHDFEKIDELPALARFVAQHPDANFYLTEYVDYQSADGFFRKYRFIFVGGEILPYHLAIGNGWKVHHSTTDMANQPWMQQEEAAFLDDPASVFQPQHYATLRAIQQIIGLDYFGIDCAIDRQGHVVVFEINATMLVHRDNASFAYKTPHIDRIKTAFDAMLTKMARP